MSEYSDKMQALRESVPQAGTTDTGESDTGESDTGAPIVSPEVEHLYRLQKMYEAYEADPERDKFSSPKEWLESRDVDWSKYFEDLE